MIENTAKLDWLEEPTVFSVNTIPAHSDHSFFEDEEQAILNMQMPLKQSLNGSWLFSYAENPASRCEDFYKPYFDCSGFSEIQVPSHIQLQGYDKCHYTNKIYPWDGHAQLRPPYISWEYNPVASYVKFFEQKENLKGKRLFLSFQSYNFV